MRINGAVLRDLRWQHGLSATDLATVTGIHRSSISRLESGERPGTPAQALALATALGVEVSTLLINGVEA